MKPQSMIALFFVACATEDPYANWDDTAGGGSWGGGAADDGEPEPTNPAPTGDSCSWGDTVCVNAGEPDNQAWCEGLSGTYSADACAEGYDGSCALPAGGDYTAPATAWYYGNSDAQLLCEGAGGTYTAAI